MVAIYLLALFPFIPERHHYILPKKIKNIFQQKGFFCLWQSPDRATVKVVVVVFVVVFVVVVGGGGDHFHFQFFSR